MYYCSIVASCFFVDHLLLAFCAKQHRTKSGLSGILTQQFGIASFSVNCNCGDVGNLLLVQKYGGIAGKNKLS